MYKRPFKKVNAIYSLVISASLGMVIGHMAYEVMFHFNVMKGFVLAFTLLATLLWHSSRFEMDKKKTIDDDEKAKEDIAIILFCILMLGMMAFILHQAYTLWVM